MDALLKDSEQLAAMIDNVSSVDNLDFIMESDALGHMVMDQRQGHETLVSVAGTVTLEEVILLIRSYIKYFSFLIGRWKGRGYTNMQGRLMTRQSKESQRE